MVSMKFQAAHRQAKNRASHSLEGTYNKASRLARKLQMNKVIMNNTADKSKFAVDAQGRHRGCPKVAGMGTAELRAVEPISFAGLSSPRLLQMLEALDELRSGVLRLVPGTALVLFENVSLSDDLWASRLGYDGDDPQEIHPATVIVCPLSCLDKSPHQSVIRRKVMQLARLVAATATDNLDLVKNETTGCQAIDSHESRSSPTRNNLSPGFRIGFSIETDNCVAVGSNDLDFVGISSRGRLDGFNVYIGTSNVRHDLRLVPSPQPLAHVSTDEVLLLIRAINRVVCVASGSRQGLDSVATVLSGIGADAVAQQLEEHLACHLRPCKPIRIATAEDHLGWIRQTDGTWGYGLPVPGGIIHKEDLRLRETLQAVLDNRIERVFASPMGNLILSGIEGKARRAIEQAVVDLGAHPNTNKRS